MCDVSWQSELFEAQWLLCAPWALGLEISELNFEEGHPRCVCQITNIKY